MARPKVTPLDEDEDEIVGSQNGNVAALLDGLEAEEEKMQAIIESLGAGGRVGVYRRPPGAPKEFYVASLDADGFNLEQLRPYGGGDFKLRFTNSMNRFVRTITVALDPTLKPVNDGPADAPRREDESALNKAIEKLTAFQPPAPADNSLLIAMMQQQSQVLQALIANMSKPVSAPAENGPLIKALLELAMKREQASPLKDTIEAMVALRELNSEKEEDDSMLKTLLKTAGPLLGQALMSKVGGQPALPTEAAPAQVENGGPTAEQLEFAKQQRVWLQRLIAAAKANEDPDFYAEMAERLLPDAVFNQLISILEKPEWFDLLFPANVEVRAEVEPHKAWFEGLRRLLLQDDEHGDPNSNLT